MHVRKSSYAGYRDSEMDRDGDDFEDEDDDDED